MRTGLLECFWLEAKATLEGTLQFLVLDATFWWSTQSKLCIITKASFINIMKTQQLDVYSSFIRPSALQQKYNQEVWYFLPPLLQQQVIVCLPCLCNRTKAGSLQLSGCSVILGPRLSRGWLTNPSTICAKRGCQLHSLQGKLATISLRVEVSFQSVAAVARINYEGLKHLLLVSYGALNGQLKCIIYKDSPL